MPTSLAPGQPSSLPEGRLPWYHWRRWGWNFLTLSILGHLLFGSAATYLVVQVIHPKPPPAFKPPGPAGPNAPTRSLEHKVSMAKQRNNMSAPVAVKRVTTTGISRTSLPAMPAMPTMGATVMPATAMGGMSGTGQGLGGFGSGGGSGGGDGGGAGGGLNLFGLRTGGVGLAGTFYDLKQTNTRQPTKMTPDMYGQILTEFANGGFNANLLNRFFKSTAPLYATQIWIPRIPAEQGPSAFHLEDTVQPSMWMVHYKGTVTAPGTFAFHFVGAGDDLMMVKFNGRLVLSRNWYVQGNWRAQANYNYGFSDIGNGFAKGDTIRVESGHDYPIEVVIGEQPGGEMFATLLQEIEGQAYDKDSKGNPILPVFRMSNAAPTASTSDRPYPPHRDDGPVWKGYPATPGAPHL